MLRVECPGCQTRLKVSEELQGKKVRCPKCKELVSVPKAARADEAASFKVLPPDAPKIKTQPGRSSEAVSKGPPPSSARPSRRDKDDEPSRRPAKSRSSFRDDDYDEDSEDLPSRRQPKAKVPALWLWAGAGAGGLLILAILIVVLLKPSSSPVQNQVAQNDPPPKENRPQPAVQPAPQERQPAAQPLPNQVEVPGAPARGQIEPETTRKVKKATAYVRVKFANGKGGQGSGFFAIERGLLFTNAHVVGMLSSSSAAPSKIDIVVNSGEPEEFTVAGKVLGVDRENDLAILRIEGNPPNLPEPLPVDSTRGLTELQDVYVFGFPHGESIGKNITISKSSISSLRKDADGTVNQVQVNGGIHHGNSGGPVVDARGVVIGVSVSIIEGTQLNFAVPGDKVLGLLRGRAVNLSLGESYQDNTGVKLPVELTCLDPMNRLQDIKIDVWVGKYGPGRGHSMQQPAVVPGDGPRQTYPLNYQNAKAAAEIQLPTLSDEAFWLQPVLTDRFGVRHWGRAVAYKLVDYMPLDRKSAFLQHQLDKEGERTVKFGNIYKDAILEGGKQATLAFNVEMETVENAKKKMDGGDFRVFVVNSKLSIEVDGKPIPDPQLKTLTFFKGKSFTYVIDDKGGLKSRSIPTLPLSNPLRTSFEGLALEISNAYEMTLLTLPNRELQPKESWDAKVPFVINGALRRKEVVDMQLKCTLEGVRSHQGQNQAVISLTGNILRRTRPVTVTGKVSGKVNFDLDKGFISQVKLKKEPTGLEDSQYVEVNLSRIEGNTTGVTPATMPIPPPPGPSLVKGRILLQSPTLFLGQGDMTNYPEKPGCPYKVFTLPFVAGKTYIVEMNLIGGGTLDPFLILHNPKNLKVAFDDDGGGDLNAKIIYRATQSGNHQIYATTLEATMSGNFQLIVAEATVGQSAPPAVAAQPGQLEELKNTPVTVNFTVKDEALRNLTIERVKIAVGNPLKSQRTATLNGRTSMQLSPVLDPKAFVDGLNQLGRVTKIEGAVITLAVNPPANDAPKTGPAGKNKTATPKAGDQVGVALASLANTNVFARKKAAEFLAMAALAPERRDEVLKTLKNYLADSDLFVRKAIILAYGHWMTEAEADGLYPALNDQDFFARKSVMEILARYPNAKSATEIAKRMTEQIDRSDAGKALQAMGAVAEPAALELLKNADWSVRSDACKILGVIGTAASKPALEMLLGDTNGLVRNSASQAIVAINSRSKK